MAEGTEIPEAKDSYEKMVAITIAIIAVILSIIGAYGEHAQTNSIIKTIQASDMWSYYQSKSIKEHLAQSESNVVTALSGSAGVKEKSTKFLEETATEQKKYQAEIKEIKEKAEDLNNEAKQESLFHQRCALSVLIMQISIVLCSVAILSRWKHFWVGGIVLSLFGIGVGISALFI